jgi:hypothetical protein
VSIARVFPAIASDQESSADPTSCHNHRLGPESLEPSSLSIVRKSTSASAPIHKELADCDFHVHIDPLMDPMILEGTNHFEARTVTNMCQSRVRVSAEITLVDKPVWSAVHERAPAFQFSHTFRCFLCVQFRHPPSIEIVPTSHRVGKMDFPTVSVINIGKGRSNAPFSHNGMGFPEQRFADQAN